MVVKYTLGKILHLIIAVQYQIQQVIQQMVSFTCLSQSSSFQVEEGKSLLPYRCWVSNWSIPGIHHLLESNNECIVEEAPSSWASRRSFIRCFRSKSSVGNSKRQVGQVQVRRIHSTTHAEWNVWPQGSVVTRATSRQSSVHTRHSIEVFLSSGILELAWSLKWIRSEMAWGAPLVSSGTPSWCSTTCLRCRGLLDAASCLDLPSLRNRWKRRMLHSLTWIHLYGRLGTRLGFMVHVVNDNCLRVDLAFKLSVLEEF